MHFGVALDSRNIDFLDIDFLDIDLLNIDLVFLVGHGLMQIS